MAKYRSCLQRNASSDDSELMGGLAMFILRGTAGIKNVDPTVLAAVIAHYVCRCIQEMNLSLEGVFLGC